MSTVLWANLLVDGKVECESEDRIALYRHAGKLDSIAKALGLGSFQAICDTTDVRFNANEFDLPPGMSSTSEVMAVEGAWLPIADAIAMLERIHAHVVAEQVRFGLFANAHAAVVEELAGVIAFARAGAPRAQRFNFCIVT